MSTSDNVATLLQQLVTLPDICLVLGPSDAICELFVDPATMDFRVDGAFVTMENGPWHIHLDATKVHKITFVITPDTAHTVPSSATACASSTRRAPRCCERFFSLCTTHRRTYVQSGCSSTRRYGLMGMAQMFQGKGSYMA